tara:strand:+ start:212 stop:601 length:390 start_codon:yes stop_codon:yes gene_type:complete
MNIATHLYILITITAFTVGACSGQGFINEDNFEDKIAKDIVAVEFWAEWNKQNEFAELSKLKDTNVYRVDIMHCSKLQAEYNISAIPTIVLFDNGVEKERFGANIMFQLEADRKTIQNSVDTITLNKFQ